MFQFILMKDGYPVRIQISRQRSRVLTVRYVRYLRGGESDYLVSGIISVKNIEVVKVPSGRSYDNDSALCHAYLHPFKY
jgi:hypothetical protein